MNVILSSYTMTTNKIMREKIPRWRNTVSKFNRKIVENRQNRYSWRTNTRQRIVLAWYRAHRRISGVMVSVLTSSAVDRGFEPRSGQTKDYEIDICCFSAKHAALSRKNKDCLARNQNNVSELRDMSTRGLLLQWASNIKIQLSVLV